MAYCSIAWCRVERLQAVPIGPAAQPGNSRQQQQVVTSLSIGASAQGPRCCPGAAAAGWCHRSRATARGAAGEPSSGTDLCRRGVTAKRIILSCVVPVRCSLGCTRGRIMQAALQQGAPVWQVAAAGRGRGGVVCVSLGQTLLPADQSMVSRLSLVACCA